MTDYDVSAVGGDYWRLLTDGEYEVIVEAEGYEPMAKLVQVNNDHQEAARLDFDLEKADTEAADDDWMFYNDVLDQDEDDAALNDYHDYYRP